jgi:ketosteroid isomerase-like protein
MTSSGLETVREFHRAMQAGNFDAMSALLSPDVVWRAAPGQDDVCANREEVLARLRELADQSVPPLESLDLLEQGEEVLVGIPSTEPWNRPDFYQRVRIQEGVITFIQDYETREDALTR